MFPAKAAGFALVILRCCIALQLVLVIPVLNLGTGSRLTWTMCAFAALALCLGAWTPAISVICFFLQFSAVQTSSGIQICASIVSLCLPLVLFLLGPGAFSIDAKRYGRRIISTRKQ
jgi:hypothetical protein